MSELDAAVQLVKVEIDGMNYCFKVIGSAGIDLIKALMKMIKKLGTYGWNKHKELKMEEIRGQVDLKDFRKKYAGDDVMLIELREADIDSFLDMCSKEGIAVTKLPDLDLQDGYSQFMVAGSTMQTIKFNFEKINRWHRESLVPEVEAVKVETSEKVNTETSAKENGTNTETKEEAKAYECGREITAMDYVHTAPGKTATEKEEAFRRKAEDMPSGEIDGRFDGRKNDLPSNKENREVINFIKNAVDDQRMLIAEENGYQVFGINETMIVGEDEKQISLQTEQGEQIDIDKSLVFNVNGKTSVYCPVDEKQKELGAVRYKGESIKADIFKDKLETGKDRTANTVIPSVKDIGKDAGKAMSAIEKGMIKK